MTSKVSLKKCLREPDTEKNDIFLRICYNGCRYRVVRRRYEEIPGQACLMEPAGKCAGKAERQETAETAWNPGKEHIIDKKSKSYPENRRQKRLQEEGEVSWKRNWKSEKRTARRTINVPR
jgi:hypothetical protein